MKALSWLESSALSTWLRESESLGALPGMLFIHTLAMGLLAGSCVVLCLRARGMAAAVPLEPLRGFLPVIRGALWVSVVSGVLLLIAYPTKALTNPVFYVKLAAIALALVAARGVVKELYAAAGIAPTAAMVRAHRLAGWSLLGWITAIVLGRLMAYTYRFMYAGEL